MAQLDYFPFYHSYIKTTAMFSDQELGRLVRALLKYSAHEETEQLAGREAVAYEFMKLDIDRARESYDVKCQANVTNGKKGGRPKAKTAEETDAEEKPNGFFENPKNPTVFSETQKTQSKSESESKGNGKSESNSSTPLPPPQAAGDVAAVAKRSAFDVFWEAYPRKAGMEEAREAFEACNTKLSTLLQALEIWKQSTEWQRQDGRFIPSAARWLTDRRWEDARCRPQPGSSVSMPSADDWRQMQRFAQKQKQGG